MSIRRGAQHAINIMDALSDAPRPLSAYDLLDRLRPTGVVAPLTIYRALEKLIASGKVHRIESLNAFVACKAGEQHMHEHGIQEGGEKQKPRGVGFAICDTCGLVREFVETSIFARVDRSVALTGFTPHATAIEVHGLCAACSHGGQDA